MGENPRMAQAVANELGIVQIHAEVSPEDKQRIDNELKAEGHKVAMAGDGINDAPALAAADVGVAMGTGTDVAIQSAGITLVKGDLRGIVSGLQLSRAVMRIISEPLFCLHLQLQRRSHRRRHPVSIFWITTQPDDRRPAMSFSSVSVISNALRLRQMKFDR